MGGPKSQRRRQGAWPKCAAKIHSVSDLQLRLPSSPLGQVQRQKYGVIFSEKNASRSLPKLGQEKAIRFHGFWWPGGAVPATAPAHTAGHLTCRRDLLYHTLPSQPKKKTVKASL